VTAHPDALTPADEQQARLLERLRAARGQPMSFEELRSLGIENPAVLCYELDLVGIHIARVHSHEAQGHAVSPGVRIDQADVVEPGAAGRAQPVAPALQGWLRRVRTGIPARAATRSIAASATAVAAGNRRSIAIAIAMVALVVVAAVASGTLFVTAGSGVRSGARGHRAIGTGTGRKASSALALSHATARAGAGAAARTHVGVGALGGASRTQAANGAGLQRERNPAGSAAQLEARGHQLLGEGRYAAAIGVLHAALGVSGQSSARCGQPGSEACLTYAYALYDLGRALRLDGQSHAAVGVLTERLHVDNQPAAVRGELERAKAGTGAGGGAGSPAEKVAVTRPVSHPKHHGQPTASPHAEADAGGTLIVMPSQR
jgi:hypothetical protein